MIGVIFVDDADHVDYDDDHDDFGDEDDDG